MCFVFQSGIWPVVSCHLSLTGWPFGSLVCKLSGMVQGISVSASVFTLVAIAVDRWVKIHSKLRVNKFVSPFT